MPELPEVTTVINTLKPLVIGKTIDEIDVYREKNVLPDSSTFVNALIGETIENIERKGKFLIFLLTNGKVFLSHLRMEGKYFFEEGKMEKNKHDILRFRFRDGTALVYNDVRKFGILALKSEDDYLATPPLAELGPEPWDLDPSSFYGELRKRHVPIKEALLDQKLIAGLGNIYDDEVLFATSIHPLRPASSITEKEAFSIIEESKRILEEAIELGGSTIKSYHPEHGVDGKMQSRLLAYGRALTPCPKCGFPLRKIEVGGRGTTFCPRCQKANKPLIVAITGPIASGKSEIGKILERHGYLRIDTDIVVKGIYESSLLNEKLTASFGKGVIDEKGQVDRAFLTARLLEDPSSIIILNGIVHPLVYEKTLEIIEKSQASKIALEVPVIFDTPFEELADLIVYVEANEKTRRERLLNRGKDPEKSLRISPKFHNGTVKRKCAIVLRDEKSLEDIEAELKRKSLF